jgi:hypothetical protein
MLLHHQDNVFFPGDGGSMLLQNIITSQTTWRHIPEDHNKYTLFFFSSSIDMYVKEVIGQEAMI